MWKIKLSSFNKFLKNNNFLISNWGKNEILLINNNGKLKKIIKDKFLKKFTIGFLTII